MDPLCHEMAFQEQRQQGMPGSQVQRATNLQSSPGEHRVTASSAEGSEGWTHSQPPSRNSAITLLLINPWCEDRLDWQETTRGSDSE